MKAGNKSEADALAEIAKKLEELKAAGGIGGGDSGTTDKGYVDLGLSVKWAKCNLGAKTPEEWGDLYCWAETEPRLEVPSKKKHKYYKKNKYDGKNPLDVLAPEDDAATVKLGREWHIPTMKQWEELYRDCIWENVYEIINGEKKLIGYKISGKKAPYDKNYIFLPMIKCYDDEGEIKGCCYWTNEQVFGYSAQSRFFRANLGLAYLNSAWWSILGIRPVFENK